MTGQAPFLSRLMLADFRSWASLDISLSGRMLVLCGDNGAGKTNILEAISLLVAGRGLRRAEGRDCARLGGGGGWAVSAEVQGATGLVQLGTGLDAPDGISPQSRRHRIDRVPVASSRAFADHLRIVWLTPAMDGLFMGAAGERRRFLDRLVLAVDADHGTRVAAMERALRNRNRLLEEGTPDRRWLDASEHELAELGTAVAAARHETVARLTALIMAGRDDTSPFPWADLTLQGEIEGLVATMPALEAEEHYRKRLRENRARDAAAGRTLVGPNTADLAVRHGPKSMEAHRSSTGEQKALLTGLVLAHARLVEAMSGLAPIVLMDEVAAHFDAAHRSALFAALETLGGQIWLTGADPAAFTELNNRAAAFRVAGGAADRLVL